MAKQGTLEQWREYLTLRSVYHLKEGDPHTFAIPRLGGRAKAAMVEIQADEYGGGSLVRMHSELFAGLMRDLDLDSAYGALWDDAPAAAFASVNTMSLFGLHRRWRGAAVGHLTAVEMTSSEPSRRYSAGLRRLGFGERTTVFYDEHVEADAVHEQIASVDMCGSLVAEQPDLLPDVLFGAAASLAMDAVAAEPPARRLGGRPVGPAPGTRARRLTSAARPAPPPGLAVGDDRLIAQPNSGGHREHDHAVDRRRDGELDAVQHEIATAMARVPLCTPISNALAIACRRTMPSARGT